ncbi:hypothetical protein ACP6PL_03800 [Dapis sp. BLCC M126]|uniref:hypothetical protein n=1 Tax=Dapis sp. BLCC M126 TaxID=3400189 RepID=UPI003CF69BFA
MKISIKILLLTLAFSVGAKAEIINHKLHNQLIPTYAHNVEISEDVACTFHITPNHNPKVGKSSLAWFALTRKGGKSLPFSECNCQLNVYAEPRNSDSKPIMNPELKGIDTEQYQDIPGAEIMFPKAGIYDLEIIGSAKDGTSFKPFKFNYSVTVTGG